MDREPTQRPDALGDDQTDPRAEVRERPRRQLLAVAVSAAVLVVAGVVALVLLGGTEDDEATGGDADPSPTTGPGRPGVQDPVEPGGPDGTPHPPGLDPQHPLVGRAEAEAREVYPLVRPEWIDGEALMLTMDLVPGRVGIAVEDGVVVAAGAEGCEELPADAAVWQQQACAPSPDDGATVWGRLIEQEGGLALEPGDGADRYYEGMQVTPSAARPDRVTEGGTVVVGLDGGPIDESELRAGQSVWLWITDGCEERYPVGCSIDAIVVER